MRDNPYRPPEAVVVDVAASASEPVPPRPRAVVFTIVVGWLFLALSIYAVARTTYYLVFYWSIFQQLGTTPYIQVALRAGLAAYFGLMLLLLRRRRGAGRWMGALFILAFLSLPIAAASKIPEIREDYFAQLAAYGLALLVMTAPTLWWLHAFAFSRKARAWWRPGTAG